MCARLMRDAARLAQHRIAAISRSRTVIDWRR